MKTTPLLVSGCFIAAVLSSTALAMTINEQVTPAYVREHPNEWFVEVTKGKDGLIDFTITHNVPRPMYHVAHLAIYQGGRLIATSDTPLFGKKRNNKFDFSIAAGDIVDSKFSLSDGALDSSGEVPVPGTVVYQFRLSDFVPKELLNE